MPSLSSESKQQIQSALDACTGKGANTGVPGLVFAAVDKSGQYLTQNTSGTKGLQTDEPMTNDSIFWIASCTKMITGIACMQLHEQGKLDIDSSKQLYELCPELKDKKVLEAPGRLVERKGEITVRKLLSHTAGFGYSFFNERLRDEALPVGWDEFAADEKDYLTMPLVNQPGSRWEYGINIDWAGQAVERVSGMKLDEYFKRHIFDKLDIKSTTFLPDRDMLDNMVTAQQRRADGSVIPVDHPFRRPLWLSEHPQHKNTMFQAGGAGCFSKPSDYCKILATLLNDGTSPTTKQQILKKETVDEMFKNQIPEFPDFARTPIPAAKPHWTNPAPELYPQEGNPPQGWGLTFMLTIDAGATGRGKNTAWWAGIINSFWWCDREKGVAGMIAGQILPFGDPNVMGTWFACEKAVYDGLT